MAVDTEQLEIDLNALLMQTHREDAEWARQLFIRRKIREATTNLARSNAYALDVLIDNMRVIASDASQQVDHEYDPQTAEIAGRYAPPTRAEQFASEIFNDVNRLQ